MGLKEDLKELLEQEELDTVSDSFGGRKTAGRTRSYSVPKIRNWLLSKNYINATPLDIALRNAKATLSKSLFKITVGNLIRFSYLIELTNLKVGSTKMKTRWLPGFILMPQQDSFEPVRGSFEPANDPRSADFNTCNEIFISCLNIISNKIADDATIDNELIQLSKNTSVPYEFVFDYTNPLLEPTHTTNNIEWSLNGDTRWLAKARPIINDALNIQLKNKIQTKIYKTDRALTGKDKTNRAKRWEVLSGDFQHAKLTQCWSAERKLLEGLAYMQDFPNETRELLINGNLIDPNLDTTSCPVTLEPLNYPTLLNPAIHGRSDYQVGHMHPLKRGGNHEGDNIRWQSSDGNRIQGDLDIDETLQLIRDIYHRME